MDKYTPAGIMLIALVTFGVCLVPTRSQAADAGTVVSPTGLTVAKSDWPWWRGPTLDGHAQGPRPPVRWSSRENVLWRTAVPGRGHASPCIWGERIFLSTAEGKPGEAKTRKGITIIHQEETPGLGSRIADADFLDRFKAKEVFPKLIVQPPGKASLNNEVDGITGATLSCKAFEEILNNEIEKYVTVIKENK